MNFWHRHTSDMTLHNMTYYFTILTYLYFFKFELHNFEALFVSFCVLLCPLKDKFQCPLKRKKAARGTVYDVRSKGYRGSRLQ